MSKRIVEVHLNDKDDWTNWEPVVVMCNPNLGSGEIYVEGQLEDSSDEDFLKEHGAAPWVIVPGTLLSMEDS